MWTIERVKLSEKHPFVKKTTMWSNQFVYKLLNTYTRQYSLGCYTTLEAANWALTQRKNRQTAYLS